MKLRRSGGTALHSGKLVGPGLVPGHYCVRPFLYPSASRLGSAPATVNSVSISGGKARKKCFIVRKQPPQTLRPGTPRQDALFSPFSLIFPSPEPADHNASP